MSHIGPLPLAESAYSQSWLRSRINPALLLSRESRSLYEGLVGQEGWREFFTQDALATFSGFGFVDEQTFRGLEFLEFRASWMEPYDDFLYEPTQILDAGGSQVVVILHQRGKPRGSDSWVEMDYGMVYTVEGGLISRGDFYATPDHALEASGLSE